MKSQTWGANNLLLEIGVEEIPARFLSPALASLGGLFRDRLEKAGLEQTGIVTYGTPRRLAVVVESLSDKARDLEQEFLGPAEAQARDADGHWTPAAQGFSRSQGVTPEQLAWKQTEKGLRLVWVKKTVGWPTEKILPSLLPDIVKTLSFPKSMTWEESRLSFARPIRWIVALFGTKVVPFSLAGVKAGSHTRGLRFQTEKPLEILSPEVYRSTLKDHCVIVDPIERRGLIVQQIRQTVQEQHGFVPLEKESDLLDEVSHLVEHPVAVLGEFDPRFLSVPREVLVTSMKKHQKFFPVYKDASCQELAPVFVGIRNGLSDSQAVVREGYERVLTARLSDAAFFFDQDRRISLADRVNDLKGVSFLSPKLSLLDKTHRVESLADWVCDQVPCSAEERSNAHRVATLAKADLTTGLVGEFPELQGVMGRIYALSSGEKPAVAQGIEEHYWPLTADGQLPSSFAESVVSLADKMDTLTGNFLLGKIPTGSQDPYGLRRATVGVLRLLEKWGWAISLNDFVTRTAMELPDTLGDRAKGSRALLDFFRQRWAALAESRGFRADEVDAVSADGLDFVADAWKRLSAVKDIRCHPDFAPLSIAFKRAANLLKQAEKKGEVLASSVKEDLFENESEGILYARLNDVREKIASLRGVRDHAGVLSALVALRGPVDNFFAQSVVMAPDLPRRSNRLFLLSQVTFLFSHVADFSRLQEVPSVGA